MIGVLCCTAVNPETAESDLDLPYILQKGIIGEFILRGSRMVLSCLVI